MVKLEQYNAEVMKTFLASAYIKSNNPLVLNMLRSKDFEKAYKTLEKYAQYLNELVNDYNNYYRLIITKLN